jgi:hypothetical protein
MLVLDQPGSGIVWRHQFLKGQDLAGTPCSAACTVAANAISRVISTAGNLVVRKFDIGWTLNALNSISDYSCSGRRSAETTLCKGGKRIETITFSVGQTKKCLYCRIRTRP